MDNNTPKVLAEEIRIQKTRLREDRRGDAKRVKVKSGQKAELTETYVFFDSQKRPYFAVKVTLSTSTSVVLNLFGGTKEFFRSKSTLYVSPGTSLSELDKLTSTVRL